MMVCAIMLSGCGKGAVVETTVENKEATVESSETTVNEEITGNETEEKILSQGLS